MAAPTIYRSTDANAPVLTGIPGSLINLLDACLVNGYGSAFASGTITNDGTQPADGDTVTIGSTVYTFRNTLAAAYDVKIGASAAATVTSLIRAIQQSGTAGTDYTAGTLAHPDAWTASTASPLTITARKGGSGGNAIVLARSAAGTPHFSVSGATLSGGSGTDSKASVGWTKSYTGLTVNAALQAVYRQPAGSACYAQVDDAAPGAGVGREARIWGFETMSAYNTGTGQFPTAATIIPIRKSSSLDGVARLWQLYADDRTFYLFVQSDGALYYTLMFGDIYSFAAGDPYKCCVIGRGSENSALGTQELFSDFVDLSIQTSHWMQRSYTGVGGPKNVGKTADKSKSSTPTGAAYGWLGVLNMPNNPDGGLYLCPAYINETSPALLRGRLRGIYQPVHPAASFADGDTFTGTGDYAGRSFVIVRPSSGSAAQGQFALETTAWDIST